MAHNEDFLKTAIPEQLWESALITVYGAGFEGVQFKGILSLLEYLAADKVATHVIATEGINHFRCNVQRLMYPSM